MTCTVKKTQRFFRKVIRIKAEDSPNVRLYLLQKQVGLTPTFEEVVPGVLSAREYLKRRKMWDKVRQCIGLDADFYLGAEILLYPPQWLNLAESFATKFALEMPKRVARAIGIDPAEGGDQTSMAAVDEWGVIEVVSKQTPDTNVVVGEVIAFGTKWGAPAENWVFDRGGGGKEHADRLRAMGYDVRSVGFGEGIALEPKRGKHRLADRKDTREEAYACVNRRAQLFWDLRQQLDPVKNPLGWGIPQEYVNLRQEMAPIPLNYDEEGRFYVVPKNKKDPNSKIKTLVELIGHSPDELDAVALGVHGMVYKKKVITIGGDNVVNSNAANAA